MPGADAAARCLARIEAELAEMARALSEGCDVAPARRARLEGMVAMALESGLCEADDLGGRAQRVLGDRGALHIAGGDAHRAVRLLLWQRRAPVYPTTSD